MELNRSATGSFSMGRSIQGEVLRYSYILTIPESLCSPLLPRPGQARQPLEIGRITWIKWVQIEPGPPSNFWHAYWDRDGPCWLAAKNWRIRIKTVQQITAIVIVVIIDKKGEPGRGINLDKSQRARDDSQGGQQYSTASSLVGLRPSLRHYRRQLGTAFIDEPGERVRIGWLSQNLACCGKEKVGLALFRC
jgi:hypothetical protein